MKNEEVLVMYFHIESLVTQELGTYVCTIIIYLWARGIFLAGHGSPIPENP